MTPAELRAATTPEQVAAMVARGWDYDAKFDDFAARAPAYKEEYALSLRVRRWSRDDVEACWIADFGWSGVSFSAFDKYPTPEAAADEAEAWLARMLAAFRFPWLTVDNDHV